MDDVVADPFGTFRYGIASLLGIGLLLSAFSRYDRRGDSAVPAGIACPGNRRRDRCHRRRGIFAICVGAAGFGAVPRGALGCTPRSSDSRSGRRPSSQDSREATRSITGLCEMPIAR
ncbi:hypothetical protein NJ7G_3170 [Natrinema sp. J7-2]|nr:hypothetical protein NJ7G_3170 [Natrinema sp. J7-2]